MAAGSTTSSFLEVSLSTSDGTSVSTTLVSLEGMLETILQKRSQIEAGRSVLVAISGIDASGKGYVSEQLSRAIQSRKLRSAVINVDLWLESADKRYSRKHPAHHFYTHGIRFPEMFALLIRPLIETRSVTLIPHLYSQAGEPFTHVYQLRDLDVVLLEGIFLFKREQRHHYDLAFWVECSFETALRRALKRNQEGLPPEDIVRDFQTIYFPAQRLHLQLDDPKSFADTVFLNDSVGR
jgi:uridine kinase